MAGGAARRFGEVYRALCFALVAQGVATGNAAAIGPSDCIGGHADSTCANALIFGGRSPTPSPPPSPTSFPVGRHAAHWLLVLGLRL